MHDYTSLAGLEHFVLEASWVLGVAASPCRVMVRVDLVLDQEHPLFEPPQAGHLHHYRKGLLNFELVTDLTWTNQRPPRGTDATGVADYGHIDWMRWDGDIYELSGEFGHLRVVSRSFACVLE